MDDKINKDLDLIKETAKAVTQKLKDLDLCWWEIYYRHMYNMSIRGYSEFIRATSKKAAIKNRENHKSDFYISFVNKDI